MIAAFGDRINQIALLSIVVYVTGNIAKYSADIMFWAIMPSVILGPFAVGLIDRWNRQKTMILSDAFRAILALSLPILMHFFHHHYVIYSVVFLIGVFSALFAPCRLAILPNLLPQKLLMSANAISSQAGTIASLAGMPIGGWIVENMGRETSFEINAITYLLSAFCVSRLRLISNVEEDARRRRYDYPIQDFKAGIQYIWRVRPILFYVMFAGVVNCLVAIFFVSFLDYIGNILGQTVGGIMLLFGILAVGMGLGGLILSKFEKWGGQFLVPMLMMGGAGVGMMVLSKIYSPWSAAAVLFAIGFCAIMVLVPLDTFLQRNVPNELRGRVFVARGVLIGLAFLISLQFSKALIYHWGVLWVLNWLGIASLAVGVVSAAFGWSMVASGCTKETLSTPA